MNQYKVTIDYRPNINSMERREQNIYLSAPNKETAILMAGHQLGLDRKPVLKEGVKITVRRTW